MPIAYTTALSISILLLFISIVFLFSNRLLFSLAVPSVLIIIIQLINQMKVHYYKSKLMFEDFTVMLDPANFDTLFHYPLAGVFVIAIVALLAITSIFTLTKSKKCLSGKIWRYVFILLLLSSTIIYGITSNTNIKTNWEASLPDGAGTITNIVMSATKIPYQPPQFSASSDYFFRKYQALRVSAPTTAERKPDIIVLLQESTVNPQLYSSAAPKLAMFEVDNNVKAHGLLRVQTFGGGTWLSEFSLLTGLNSDDFGSRKNAVYYSVVEHIQRSLFKELKKNGYYTAVLTPFNKSAYHAGEAYKQMGIDRIIQPQELGYPAPMEKNLWHISSKEILNYVRLLLKEKNDKPLFIFALTMNEHGPYDDSYQDIYRLANRDKNPGLSNRFSHYISKLAALSDATQDFSTFVAQRQKPTIFLYFGDHQPGLGWHDDYNTQYPNAKFLTQFYLKDNLSIDNMKDTGPITDISFLGGMLLERASLQLSPFYQANIAMRHLCQGASNDCNDQKLVQSYKNYIYQQLRVAGT